MKIDRVDISRVCIPMRRPFITACGPINERHLLIVKVYSEGVVGLGECSANLDPIYNAETISGCRHIIVDFLLPALLGRELPTIDEVRAAMGHVVGNHMAKSAIELACWDVMSRQTGTSIRELIGGGKDRVSAGVSVGMFDTMEQTLEEVQRQLSKGFQRLKVKIKPGHDREVVTFLERELGDVPLMVDANSSYTLADAAVLRSLDEFGLTQIEQPLEHDDIVDHAALQAQLQTPICLDESVVDARAARQAIQLGSCGVINVKISRVGGLRESMGIEKLCRESNTDLWCGSMLESGVGMMYNIIFSSLGGVSQPGDIQESRHYMSDDIVEPLIEMAPDGTFGVPAEPGIGVQLDPKKFRAYLLHTEVFRP